MHTKSRDHMRTPNRSRLIWAAIAAALALAYVITLVAMLAELLKPYHIDWH